MSLVNHSYFILLKKMGMDHGSVEPFVCEKHNSDSVLYNHGHIRGNIFIFGEISIICGELLFS